MTRSSFMSPAMTVFIALSLSGMTRSVWSLPPDPSGPSEELLPDGPAAAPAPVDTPRKLPPPPFLDDDKRALKRLAKRLPEHGLLPIAAPSFEAPDEDWHRFSKKLLQVFAPESLKPADRRVLLDARPLAPALETLVPTHRRYRELQKLLALYSTRMGLHPMPIPETRYKVRVGVTAPEVGLLRDRLQAEGYGDEGVSGKLRDYFDDRLKRALQAWQKDHSLPATTVLDPLTRRSLNAPIILPVADIALSLARFRSIDLRRDSGRQILVHINAFSLAAEHDGRPELTMPVVVGRDNEKDQTPMLSANLKSVVINPTWVVPQRIIDERLRPEAKDIPEFLIDKGYTVQVDDAGRWRVRMGPGPDNPLGKLKFLLEDTNGVYLHDTNARSAFSKDARALSAGCVRLLDPMALALWLLPEQGTALEEAAQSMTSSTLAVENIQVHLVYQTTLAEDGRLVRFSDIYSRDAAPLGELDPVAIAEARRALRD